MTALLLRELFSLFHKLILNLKIKLADTEDKTLSLFYFQYNNN